MSYRRGHAAADYSAGVLEHRRRWWRSALLRHRITTQLLLLSKARRKMEVPLSRQDFQLPR